MTFRAKYPGTCSDCGDPIEVDDILDWNGDQTAAIHHGCAIESKPLKPRGICPRCNVELPVSGVCGVCDPETGDAA